MPKHKIRPPTLYLRTSHFADGLVAATGLSAAAIERRVRENQYDRYDLPAPDEESVLDYFALYRSVAFEPRQNDIRAPWLLAAELEFPGCSYRYFHPLIDLLFGLLEAGAFWRDHFRKIPNDWIFAIERNGHPQIATEWRAMNDALQRREHRKKQPEQKLDQLSFLHLSMLRLPDLIKCKLFERKGFGSSWSRTYVSQPSNFGFLNDVPPADGLAALISLTAEAAEIGDTERYLETKSLSHAFLPRLAEDPSCRRIHEQLAHHVSNYLQDISPRRYSQLLHHGFGAPASWRVVIGEKNLLDQMERFKSITDEKSE